MTSHGSQVAKKILCIGGSTHNQDTPYKIREALIASNFLEEWAVIFVNHSYFKLNNSGTNSIGSYTNKINSDFNNLNITFVDGEQQYIIKKNYVYIIPDSGIYQSTSWIYAHFSANQKKLPMIEVPNSQASFQLVDAWYDQNQYYASGNKRDYIDLPYIDKFMGELAQNRGSLDKIAGLIVCGLYEDGANGLKEIRNSGGNTAVQFPNECCNPLRQGATFEMPHTALQIEPNHQTISLESTPNILSLTQWLSEIK